MMRSLRGLFAGGAAPVLLLLLIGLAADGQTGEERDEERIGKLIEALGCSTSLKQSQLPVCV